MLTELLVAKLNQFEELSQSDQDALESIAGKVKVYDRNEDIILQGENPDNVHLLLDGWACRYKMVPDGERQIMAYLIPGDLCDVHVTLLDEMDHSISALAPCTVLLMPRNTLTDLMARNAQLSRSLWWCTLVDEAILREWIVNLGRRNAEQRVAHLICEMLLRCRAVGLTSDHTFAMPLTQQELADSMGLSSVHMNRCLQALKGAGLITTQERRVTIHDYEKLAAFAGFDPIYLHQVRKAVPLRPGRFLET